MKKNWPLFLILGLPLALMTLSYSLYSLDETKTLDVSGALGTKKVGDLITPALPLDALGLVNQDEALVSLLNTETPWTLLVVGQNNAQDALKANLFESQQMHVALGRDAHKLQRVVIEQGDTQYADLPERIRSIKRLQANPQEKEGVQLLQDNDYLLVDARGWVMMAYPTGTSEKAMMADIRHLFKYAR